MHVHSLHHKCTCLQPAPALAPGSARPSRPSRLPQDPDFFARDLLPDPENSVCVWACALPQPSTLVWNIAYFQILICRSLLLLRPGMAMLVLAGDGRASFFLSRPWRPGTSRCALCMLHSALCSLLPPAMPCHAMPCHAASIDVYRHSTVATYNKVHPPHHPSRVDRVL